MRKLLLAALSLAGCGDSTPPGFAATGVGGTSPSGSTSGSSSGSESSSTGRPDDSAGNSTGSTSGVVGDLGSMPDFGGVQPVGCKGKVDLLFLVSRLHTMKTEQAQLLASFPGFVDTVQETLSDFDVHIMVANPDGIWPGWVCEEGCNQKPPACDAYGYKCNDLAYEFKDCDATLGAGLVLNAGADAANRKCELYGGNRYIVRGETKMEDGLECIAKVGWSGGDPPMGEALVAALAPEMNARGGCNEGFLRDDALLFIALINDTADTESYTWPYQWYDKIMAVKKDPSAVVVLGVVPQPHKEGEPYVEGCTYDVGEPGKLRDFIDMFPYSVYGDTCAPSYAPYFEAAAAKISEACGSFVPQ